MRRRAEKRSRCCYETETASSDSSGTLEQRPRPHSGATNNPQQNLGESHTGSEKFETDYGVTETTIGPYGFDWLHTQTDEPSHQSDIVEKEEPLDRAQEVVTL